MQVHSVINFTDWGKLSLLETKEQIKSAKTQEARGKEPH